MTKHYKILVLGHPRCGTGYSSKLLESFKFKIGHEYYARDGISSWGQAPIYEENNRLKPPWGPTRFIKSTYDILIHCVRDPYNALVSIIAHNRPSRKSQNFIRSTILNYFKVDINNIINEIDAAAASYYYWNKLIEQQKPNIRIKIENDQQLLAKYINNYFKKNKKKKQINIKNIKMPPTNYNTRPKKEIDLSVMSSKYLVMMDTMCLNYGYPKLSQRIIK